VKVNHEIYYCDYQAVQTSMMFARRSAMLIARFMFGKADLTMALNGALAGLVAITAEPSRHTALRSAIPRQFGTVLE